MIITGCKIKFCVESLNSLVEDSGVQIWYRILIGRHMSQFSSFSTKSLRKTTYQKPFFSAHSWRLLSIMVGEALQQEQEAADSIVLALRKRQVEAVFHSPSFCSVCHQNDNRMLPLTFSLSLPLQLISSMNSLTDKPRSLSPRRLQISQDDNVINHQRSGKITILAYACEVLTNNHSSLFLDLLLK